MKSFSVPIVTANVVSLNTLYRSLNKLEGAEVAESGYERMLVKHFK